MNSDQLIKAFHATVQASLHGLRALAPALEQERDALSARDPGALEAIVKQKVALLQQLTAGPTTGRQRSGCGLWCLRC